MSGLRSIVSPRLMGSLSSVGFFPDTVTIEARTESANEYREVVETWTPVTGLTSIAANVQPVAETEHRTPVGVYTDATHVIAFPRVVAGVTTQHRATDTEGRTFDILGVETDTFGTFTRLHTRIVTA